MITILLVILLLSGYVIDNNGVTASSDICTVNFGRYNDIVSLSSTSSDGAMGQKKSKKPKNPTNFVTKAKQQSIFYNSWFNCTGNLTQWSFAAKFNGANKDRHPELQVWRLVGTTTLYYSKISATLVQVNTALTSNVYSINLDPPIRVQYGDVIGVFQPEKKKSSMEMYLYKTVINYDYYFIDKLDDAKSTVYSSEVKVKEDEFPLITAVIEPSITVSSSTLVLWTQSSSLIITSTSATIIPSSTRSSSLSLLITASSTTFSPTSSLSPSLSPSFSSLSLSSPSLSPSLFSSSILQHTIVMTTATPFTQLPPTPVTVTMATPIQVHTHTQGVSQFTSTNIMTVNSIHNVRTSSISKSITNNNIDHTPLSTATSRTSSFRRPTPVAPPHVDVPLSDSSDDMNHMLVGFGVGLVGILVGVVISGVFVGVVIVLVKKRKGKSEERMMTGPKLAPYRIPNRYIQKNVPLYEGTSTIITVPTSNNISSTHQTIDHAHFNTLDSTHSGTLSSTQSSTLNSTRSDTLDSTHLRTNASLNSAHTNNLSSTHTNTLSSAHTNNLSSTHSSLSVTVNGVPEGVYELIKEEEREEGESGEGEKCKVVIQGSPYEKPVQFEEFIDTSSLQATTNQDLYVPDEEQRRQLLNDGCYEFDNKLYQSLYQAQHANDDLNPKTNEGKQFFKESQEYWRPHKTTGGIYRQLASKRYREIPRQNIQVTQYLGSGQFATVNKALWLTGGGDVEVAVKMLKTGSSEQEKIKFLQEAAINGQFHHLNVVRLLGVVTVGEPVIIVLELLRNGNLKKYLTSKRPKNGVPVPGELPHQLFNFCKQVSAGMEYLAKKTFIHRDLAARNILVSDQLICKVADFGMSRDLEESSYYISQGGLVPIKWTAPEAIFYRKYSSASDVWSFGVLMFEIWSLGRKPYTSLTNEQYIERIDEGERLAPPPGCPRPFYHLMMDCWHPEPIERPSFTAIHQYLSQPKNMLLQHGASQVELSEAGSTDAITIGAPLETGQVLFKDLQIRYLD